MLVVQGLFLKTFHRAIWVCCGSDVFGTVLRCQKSQGWTTRTEILCFLFGSDMVACSWLGGCFGGRLI